MVSNDELRTIFGMIGNAISLVLYLSPLPTFVKIWKNKDVQQFSSVPYLATLLNCMLWLIYGLPIVHPHSTLVLTINGAGVTIELVYIAIYLVFSSGATRIKVIAAFLAEVAFSVVFAVLVITLVHSVDRRSSIVGAVCIFFCIMMYVAPLSVMKLVIQTKSVEYMPLYISVAACFNGACWTVYALLRFDINVLVPNSVGFVFAVLQLILYAIYYKSTQRQIAARMRGEIGMTDVVVRSDGQ